MFSQLEAGDQSDANHGREREQDECHLSPMRTASPLPSHSSGTPTTCPLSTSHICRLWVCSPRVSTPAPGPGVRRPSVRFPQLRRLQSARPGGRPCGRCHSRDGRHRGHSRRSARWQTRARKRARVPSLVRRVPEVDPRISPRSRTARRRSRRSACRDVAGRGGAALVRAAARRMARTEPAWSAARALPGRSREGAPRSWRGAGRGEVSAGAWRAGACAPSAAAPGSREG
jgi:hypothetical protein